MRIKTCDLKPKTDYYLTFDFWPKGGTKVTFSRKFPGKEIWGGTQREGVIVKDDSGNEYAIHPSAWLFDESPLDNNIRTC